MAKQLDKSRNVAADKRKDKEPEAEAAPPKKRGKLKLLILIGLALVIVAGAGGAYFFMFSGGSTKPGASKEAPPPQPFFVEIKPFIITMKASDGSLHYVQLALSLKVPNEDAVTAANAVMPEILDMIRQSVLGFKIDDLQTQDGVNKLRSAIAGGSNRVLLTALGTEKIKALGGTAGMLVKNVYFQNLVIE